MLNQASLPHDKASRIQLIGRVQLAYEHLRETMQRYRDDSPRARAAIASAKRRLTTLNRALAMLALEAAAHPA
jgi:heme oxygenase